MCKTEGVQMGKFISELKDKDAYNHQLNKVLKRFYIILVGVYLLLMVVNPFADFHLYHRLNGALFVLAFSWFALLFGRYQQKFGQVDYAQPTIAMLKKVVERYRMSAKVFIQLLPPVIFVGLALSISAYYQGSSEGSIQAALTMLGVFLIVVIVAIIAGYLVWRKKHKPLHDIALLMLNELQR